MKYKVVMLGVFCFCLAFPSFHVSAQNKSPMQLQAYLEESEKAFHISLNWEGPSGDITVYNVYRRQASADEPLLIGATESETFIDYRVEKGSTYYYSVTAVGPDMIESPPSFEISVHLPESGDSEEGSLEYLLAGELDAVFLPGLDQKKIEKEAYCRDTLSRPGEHLTCLLLLGDSNLLAGKFDESMTLLKKLLDQAGGFPSSLAYGIALYLNGEFEEAIHVAEEEYARSPDSGEILLLLGKLNMALTQYDLAREHFTAARDKFPDDYWPSFLLAYTLTILGESVEAMELLEEISDEFPGEIEIMYLLGRLNEFVKDFDEARNKYNDLSELIPLDTAVSQSLSDLHSKYLAAGEPLEFYEDMVEASSGDGQAWYHLGETFLMTGKVKDALDAYRESQDVSERRGYDIRPYLVMSQLANIAGDFDGALSLTEKALEIDKNSSLLKRSRAEALLGKAVWVESSGIFSDLSKEKAGPGSEDLLAGLTLAMGGMLVEGRKKVEEFMNRNPQSYFPNLLLGNICLALGDHARAVDYLEKAYRQSPGEWTAAFNLSVALVRSGNPLEGASILEDTLEFYPDDWPILYNLAVCLHKAGKTKEAEKYYRRALDITPGLVEARANLGTIFALSDNLGSAVEKFRECLDSNPEHLTSAINLGLAYYYQGNLQQAEKILESVAVSHPGMDVVRQYLTILRKSH